MDVVSAIEACGTRSGSPTAVVRIVDCGVLESDQLEEDGNGNGNENGNGIGNGEEEEDEGLSVLEEKLMEKVEERERELGIHGNGEEENEEENENENENENERTLNHENIHSLLSDNNEDIEIAVKRFCELEQIGAFDNPTTKWAKKLRCDIRKFIKGKCTKNV